MSSGLSFDDVLLRPQRSVLSSRSEASTRSLLYQGTWIDIPIMSAPMSSVTNWKTARKVVALGGAAVIPRQQPVEEQFKDWAQTVAAVGGGVIFCAVGYDLSRFIYLYNKGVRAFCLDVAHAHSDDAARTLRQMYARTAKIKVIAGAVATAEGAAWLADSGVDAVTVGIGPGAACRTREVTGFGIPQLTAIQEVASAVGAQSGVYGLGVVANGGIKNSGDIVKALAAGATTVMLGKLLAQATDAPGNGEYWGSASSRENGHRAAEGAVMTLERTQTLEDIVKELVWGIRSGISYCGGADIETLQKNAEFVPCAPGVWQESMVRV